MEHEATDERGPGEEGVPLEDVPQEAMRLIAASQALSVPIRLIGGTAVWFHCPSARTAPLARPYGDIDFVSISKHNKELGAFFEQHGYEADRLFNALHGAQRLNFTDSVRGRALDVLLDRFHMCHTIELQDRLALDPATIPITDLLLTKAQVIQLNEKDLKDLMALLLDHAPGAGIDLDRLTEATRSDWGLEHTVRKTLAEVDAALESSGLEPAQAQIIRTNITMLTAALDTAPKSARWRMRARVGERIRWYDLPEEARR